MSNEKEVTRMKYPNIDAERARNGLSANEFAEQLGVSRKTLYNWITNGSIPANALVRMADMFKCTVDYLLGR